VNQEVGKNIDKGVIERFRKLVLKQSIKKEVNYERKLMATNY